MSEQASQASESDDDDDTAGSRTPSPSVAAAAFPPSFLHWLSVHGIDPQLYSLSHSLPRYVRINPRSSLQPSSLASQLATPLHRTAIPHFFRLSASASLASCPAYRQGDCYGMDLASAVAVRALDLQAEHCGGESDCLHVLDLCAAPGAKLAYLHDLLSCSPSARPFSLTGVDISLQRLSCCRNVLNKYGVSNTRLCLADGRSFNTPPPPPPRCPAAASHPTRRPARQQLPIHDLLTDPEHPSIHANKRQQRAIRRRQRRGSQQPALAGFPSFSPSSLPPPLLSCPSPCLPSSPPLYHRVLVDAECSHDGSVRHIAKLQRAGSAAFERRLLSAHRLSALQATQRQLIARGWQLLADGGVLVYSTCSLCREQGEDIVEWLMDTEGRTAQLCPALAAEEGEEVGAEEESGLLKELHEAEAVADKAEPEEGADAGQSRVRWKRALPFRHLLPQQPQLCVRLDPLISRTSGLFIAKLKKLSTAGQQVEMQDAAAQSSHIVETVECSRA